MKSNNKLSKKQVSIQRKVELLQLLIEKNSKLFVQEDQLMLNLANSNKVPKVPQKKKQKSKKKLLKQKRRQAIRMNSWWLSKLVKYLLSNFTTPMRNIT